MPIYEYECRGCGHQFEFLLLPAHPAAPACPSCKGEDLERVISMFAVSSDGSRKLALNDGRKRAAGVNRDKAHAEAEYQRDHQH
ncbi:MAG: zinc ribbon domain-containing protein [Vicinamibacterales bacterium]